MAVNCGSCIHWRNPQHDPGNILVRRGECWWGPPTVVAIPIKTAAGAGIAFQGVRFQPESDFVCHRWEDKTTTADPLKRIALKKEE